MFAYPAAAHRDATSRAVKALESGYCIVIALSRASDE
jgi:hypothetical protein